MLNTVTLVILKTWSWKVAIKIKWLNAIFVVTVVVGGGLKL